MTNYVSGSNLTNPFFIGFESVLNRLNDRTSNNGNTSYPPYNLIKIDEQSYLVELAVAGFDEEDLNIHLHQDILTVSANIGDMEEEAETDYLHKGIAARSFVRKFTLADGIEIMSASLKQGMLTIRLKNVVPEEKKPKRIPINGNMNSDKKLLTETS